MTFYTGEAIPGWQDNLLIGGLSSQAIIRLTLDGERVAAEERIPMGERIRDVVQGAGRLRLCPDRRRRRQDSAPCARKFAQMTRHS